MTCYFKHLKQTFENAGIEVSKENKGEIDKAIHRVVGVEYRNCSATGKEVRRRVVEDEGGFIFELRKTVSPRTQQGHTLPSTISRAFC